MTSTLTLRLAGNQTPSAEEQAPDPASGSGGVGIA